MDEGTPPRLLLEGRPGIGKTTLARRLLALLHRVGVPVGGFITAELRTGGRREGFAVEAVSGARGILAHVDLPGPLRVGRYGVDLPTFERVALPALRAPGTGGMLVIDELSKMELASAAFQKAVADLLGRDVAVVATVQVGHHRFTDALKRRPDIRVVRVTADNRDALPEQLRDSLLGARQGRAGERSLDAQPAGGGPRQAGGPRASLGAAGARAGGPLSGRHGPHPQLRGGTGGRWAAGLAASVADAPQPPVRARALADGKLLYMAVPRLADERPFILLDPERLDVPPRRAASISGSTRVGRRVGVAELQPVDLVVCGSVAVNRQGARVGKGGGFSDLEFALLVEAGLISQDSVLATTVHPLQVLDEALPETSYDFRVDVIVAGEEVIGCRRSRRPPGILWEHLDAAKIAAIPALAERRRAKIKP
jgi:5-formyltetrahydrofolate cyclo-ligase